MGDENSLQGRTQAHRHSATSSDGGFLSTSVTGITNLSQGSTVYGNASEIVTELNIGGAGDLLTVAGGLPSWQPASGTTRTILDSQTFSNDTEDTITFNSGGIDDSTYQKLQVVFTGDGLGNSIQRCMFRLDSNTPADYNENSIEVYNGSASYQDKNPMGGTDNWVRITDQLANSGKSWIATVDIMIPTAGQTHTTIFYQVATYDRWASGSGFIEGQSVAGEINRIEIELQGSLAKDMQFTVYGITF